ncbi:MAG: type IV secretory system conjugative DNA transfer family protein, partial [Pseudomonadota bacterium]
MAALPFVAESLLHARWTPSFFSVLAYVFSLGMGIGGALYWHRIWVPRLNWLASKLTKKTQLERNRRTDVREIGKFLPAEIGGYDPQKFIKPERGLFIGLDEKRKPVYINYEDSRIQHMLLTGRTRSGKGVAAQIIIPQQIARGEFVVVLDPKVDNWMPHAFRDACIQADKPYHFLDLRQSAPAQCNPFAGCPCGPGCRAAPRALRSRPVGFHPSPKCSARAAPLACTSAHPKARLRQAPRHALRALRTVQRLRREIRAFGALARLWTDWRGSGVRGRSPGRHLGQSGGRGDLLRLASQASPARQPRKRGRSLTACAHSVTCPCDSACPSGTGLQARPMTRPPDRPAMPTTPRRANMPATTLNTPRAS